MKTINYYMLEANNACPDHLKLFRDTFGDGEVAISKENLKIALDAKLDVWFLTRFLSGAALAEYKRVEAEAWAENERVRDAAWAEYNRVRSGALAKYNRVCGEAWAEYNRVRSGALAKYNRVCGEAWDEYIRVCGEALIDLLNRA
jgi:hypothetical protein